jgi:glycosyltransferase involved in cell wall biosynthesis
VTSATRDVPRVSIVIPARDAVRWLPETLASALAQTHVTTEIIVVDDGSTDGTADLAAGYGDRVRVIRQPPSGVSAARNAGTSAARGEFIQYLDADDVLEDGTVAARVTLLDRTGADVALTDYARWQKQADGTFKVERIMRHRLGDRPDVQLLTYAWWPPGAMLYRRTIVDRIGPWRADLRIIQDARFQLDAALVGARFAQIEEVGLRYRMHGATSTSLSRRDPLAFVNECFESASELHDRWQADGTLDEPRRDGLLRVYHYVARSVFKADRARYAEVTARIDELAPRFVPDGPAWLRQLSRLFGYRAAEHITHWLRQVRTVSGLPTPKPGEW